MLIDMICYFKLSSMILIIIIIIKGFDYFILTDFKNSSLKTIEYIMKIINSLTFIFHYKGVKFRILKSQI